MENLSWEPDNFTKPGTGEPLLYVEDARVVVALQLVLSVSIQTEEGLGHKSRWTRRLSEAAGGSSLGHLMGDLAIM